MTFKNLLLLALEESPLRHLLERALQSGGFEVAVAPTPAILNSSLINNPPGLVVMSALFKGKETLSLCAQTLERFPTLPIILISENESLELIQQAMRVGISECLFSPLRVEDIVAAVRRSRKRADLLGDWVRQELKFSTRSLETKVGELEALVEVGRQITGSLHIDSILERVVSSAARLTSAESASLLLLDDSGERLNLRASHNLAQIPLGAQFSLAGNLAGKSLRTMQPISAANDHSFEAVEGHSVHALLYVPLRVKDRSFGALGVHHSQSGREFSDSHSLLLTVLADYAATAIENADLLQSSERERIKLETTLTRIDEVVIVLDDVQSILFINAAARKAFGLGLSKLDGQPFRDVVDHVDIYNLMDSAQENPLKEYEVAFADGRIYTAQYTLVPGVGWAITMQDVTGLKMLNRVKNDFIHTISHDLRSPLTAIMGYVELLERIGPLTDQQKEFAKRVQNSVQQILALINDLLDLGRIEAGFDAGKDSIQLETVLRFTLENLQKTITEKRINLTVKTSENMPTLRGNPIRIRQLVDNLVGNAVKYTPANGSVEVKLLARGQQIILEVKDTGLGIPLEDQPHIFEKFYRASNTPKGVPGTGLGLAIVKSIVDGHAGRIWVESTLGSGSVFYVILPILQEE